MSYQPYDRQPSGIVFFGSNPADQVYESVADLSYDSGNNILLTANLTASSTVKAGSYIVGDNGTIGTSGTSNAITIASDGAVSIFGDLTVNGTTTTVNSTTLTVEDPIIVLGSGTPTADDNKDRGVSFNYYDGAAKTGFFGFDDSSGKFAFIPDATITNEVVTGASGTIVADLQGNADSATKLETSRFIGVSDQLIGSGSFDGTSNNIFNVQLTDNAINGQTETTTANNTDYLLIASGTELRKISKSNFVSNLGGMSSFIVDDGTTSETVNNGETILFSDGTGAEFVITTDGNEPTITVNSVDSEIDHDALNNFVANEHINHTGVVLTAGSGLLGGGDISASRTFDIGAGTGISVDANSVNLTNTTVSSGGYGSASGVATFTVDEQGRLTAANTVNIEIVSSQITDFNTAVSTEIFESSNFVDSQTVDFTVTAGTSVTASVKDTSITEAKRSRTIETINADKANDYAYKDISIIDASSNNVTVTLPSSTSAGRMMVFKRKDNSSNTVTIQRNGSDTIDESTSFQLYYKFETLTLVSDGGNPTNWYVI